MAKYCRYYENAYRDRCTGGVGCSAKGKFVTRKQAKKTNDCADFQLNPVDALRENVKGYQPTGRKIVQFGGLGKQITLEEVME